MHLNEDLFSYERISTRTPCFEKEAKSDVYFDSIKKRWGGKLQQSQNFFPHTHTKGLAPGLPALKKRLRVMFILTQLKNVGVGNYSNRKISFHTHIRKD